MDPAICDSCLHLTAIRVPTDRGSEGVPVACQAVQAPPRSRPSFRRGFATAVPGDMRWRGLERGGGFAVAGLLSKSMEIGHILPTAVVVQDKVRSRCGAIFCSKGLRDEFA
jgi:hypothetical protein